MCSFLRDVPEFFPVLIQPEVVLYVAFLGCILAKYNPYVRRTGMWMYAGRPPTTAMDETQPIRRCKSKTAMTMTARMTMAAMNDYDREAGGGRMMRAAAVVAYKI